MFGDVATEEKTEAPAAPVKKINQTTTQAKSK
jgi:hypothetical protein